MLKKKSDGNYNTEGIIVEFNKKYKLRVKTKKGKYYAKYRMEILVPEKVTTDESQTNLDIESTADEHLAPADKY